MLVKEVLEKASWKPEDAKIFHENDTFDRIERLEPELSYQVKEIFALEDIKPGFFYLPSKYYFERLDFCKKATREQYGALKTILRNKKILNKDYEYNFKLASAIATNRDFLRECKGSLEDLTIMQDILRDEHLTNKNSIFELTDIFISERFFYGLEDAGVVVNKKELVADIVEYSTLIDNKSSNVFNPEAVITALFYKMLKTLPQEEVKYFFSYKYYNCNLDFVNEKNNLFGIKHIKDDYFVKSLKGEILITDIETFKDESKLLNLLILSELEGLGYSEKIIPVMAKRVAEQTLMFKEQNPGKTLNKYISASIASVCRQGSGKKSCRIDVRPYYSKGKNVLKDTNTNIKIDNKSLYLSTIDNLIKELKLKEIKEKAETAIKLFDTTYFRNDNPRALAAAVVYHFAKDSNLNISQKKIVDIVGIREITLRTYYRKILELKRKKDNSNLFK